MKTKTFYVEHKENEIGEAYTELYYGDETEPRVSTWGHDTLQELLASSPQPEQHPTVTPSPQATGPLRITSGEWKVETDEGVSYITATPNNVAVCSHADGSNEANAALIAEAGTVANETQLTPRQLLEQRDALLDALDTLSLVVGLTPIKYPEQLAALQDAIDAALDAIARVTGGPGK